MIADDPDLAENFSPWVGGPMARTVPDLALMLDAMAALTTHDLLSRPVPAGGFQVAMRQGRPPRRIGFSADLMRRRVDPEVAAVCEAAAQRCGAMGTTVEGAAPDFRARSTAFRSCARCYLPMCGATCCPRSGTASILTSCGILRRCTRSGWRDYPGAADAPCPVLRHGALLRRL
jgi:Asp-tRNA(Asn)/Glu-tRNA(Gln) amidotransferase A subunit family amidase